MGLKAKVLVSLVIQVCAPRFANKIKAVIPIHCSLGLGIGEVQNYNVVRKPPLLGSKVGSGLRGKTASLAKTQLVVLF